MKLGFVAIDEWHPEDTARTTSCIHEAMERQKFKGAADFTISGSTEATLAVPAPRIPLYGGPR